MLFVLKIIRFFLGLFVKIFTFPIKLAWRLVGDGSDDEFETSVGGDTSAEGSERTGAATAPQTDEAGTLEVDPETAARNVTWFRKGLVGVGAIQAVLGVIISVGLGSMPGGGLLVSAVLGGVVVTAVLPIVIGIGISRRPTAGWYAGMALIGLYIAGSVLTLPTGLLWIVVFSVIGYLGYTGRPALHRVYADGRVAGESEETTRPAENVDSGVAADVRGDTVEPAATDADGSAGTTDVAPVESATSAPGAETVTAAERNGPAERHRTDAPATAGEMTEESVRGQTNGETSVDDTDGTVQAQAEETETETETETEADETSGSEYLSEYQEGLTSDDPVTRQETVHGLADAAATEDTPDRAVIDALTERLTDEDNTEVRVAACEALGRLGTEGGHALSVLKDHRLDADTDVSRAASRALRDGE